MRRTLAGSRVAAPYGGEHAAGGVPRPEGPVHPDRLADAGAVGGGDNEAAANAAWVAPERGNSGVNAGEGKQVYRDTLRTQ